jgi:hypothetical protein
VVFLGGFFWVGFYCQPCFQALLAAENGGFLATYYWAAHYQTGRPLDWFTLGAIIIVLGGTLIGLLALLLYYRSKAEQFFYAAFGYLFKQPLQLSYLCGCLSCWIRIQIPN